jgi:chorismate mutase
VTVRAVRGATQVERDDAARRLGLNDVALLCAQEMVVAGSMSRVVRLLTHVHTERSTAELVNVYPHGTELLRADVPPVPADEQENR